MPEAQEAPEVIAASTAQAEEVVEREDRTALVSPAQLPPTTTRTASEEREITATAALAAAAAQRAATVRNGARAMAPEVVVGVFTIAEAAALAAPMAALAVPEALLAEPTMQMGLAPRAS
jgi:hypothetical protein